MGAAVNQSPPNHWVEKDATDRAASGVFLVGGIMKNKADLNMVLVTIFTLLGITGCAIQSRFPRSDPPSLPSKPLPVTAFTVRFVPAGNQTYTPTKATDIKLYRIVLHTASRPEGTTRRDEKPSRPYITVGKLYFGENWYTGKNLDELTEKYVPEVGGDAVLTWEIFQTAAAFIPGAGPPYTYATYEVEVIRYTDR